MLIIHHNDADGRCAAAIAFRWAKQQRRQETRIAFFETDYKTPPPLDQIRPDDTVVIVDFSYKPDDMAAITARTNIGVIWCDHHETAKDYGYDVAGVRDFTDKGKSGCECAWEFFFPHNAVPYGVTLLGDYDAWRLSDPPRCFEFYEGLKLFKQTPDGPLWDSILDGSDDTLEIIEQGRVAIAYRDNYCRSIRTGYGYETSIDGHPAFAANIYQFGSPGFGSAFQKYPVCMAYIHDGRKFTVSLYSETVDVSAIAKAHGGGGHKGAAGFVCERLPFAPAGGLFEEKQGG